MGEGGGKLGKRGVNGEGWKEGGRGKGEGNWGVRGGLSAGRNRRVSIL